ncbi:retrovirus-related pol polyprotein from transposon TNT 1-94 [Tanacetum coccineum]
MHLSSIPVKLGLVHCKENALDAVELSVKTTTQKVALQSHETVMATKPKTMQDAIEFATELMDKKINTFAERQDENKRKLDNNNQAQQQLPKRQNMAQAYAARTGERKGLLYNNQRTLTCYECGNQGHYKSDCLELKNGNQAGGAGTHGMVLALVGREPHQDLDDMEDKQMLDFHFFKIRLTFVKFVGPFKVLEQVESIAYKLKFPQGLNRVHNTFHVSNLRKCYADKSLVVPLGGLHLNNKLWFVEKSVEVMNREVKRLRQSRNSIVKVRWNSRQVTDTILMKMWDEQLSGLSTQMWILCFKLMNYLFRMNWSIFDSDFYLSNMILYDQYVKDNAMPVVQSNVSSVPNDAYMMIFNYMHETHAQPVSVTTQNTVVDNSLTAKLATYKEQVKLYERRAKFKLTEREQKIDEQLRIVITDHNIKEETLKKELHSVKMQLNAFYHQPYTRLTEGERGFEQPKEGYLTEVIPFFKTLKEHFEGIQKALTKEIKEMKDIFEELEAEVDQNVIDRKHDEIERKNLLIANDNLIADCLSKEVFYIATNSELNVSKFTEMHEAYTIVQKRYLELEAELSKL